MPRVGRKLAGDERRSAAGAVLHYPHQIAPLTGGEALRTQVVEDQEIGLDQRAEQLGKAAVAVGELDRKTGAAGGVVDGVAVRQGLLGERAGQPRLADLRPGDEQIAALGDPAAGGKPPEQRLVEAARRAQVDVLDRCLAMTQLGAASRLWKRLALRLAASRSSSSASHPGWVRRRPVLSLELKKGVGHAVELYALSWSMVDGSASHVFSSVEVTGATHVVEGYRRPVRGGGGGRDRGRSSGSR